MKACRTMACKFKNKMYDVISNRQAGMTIQITVKPLVKVTQYKHLNVSRLVLPLFLSNPIKPSVKTRMKM